MTMTESTEDNVIEIMCRLRDGRAVVTEEDLQQWRYEYLEPDFASVGQRRH
jgi:hypothetical protein